MLGRSMLLAATNQTLWTPSQVTTALWLDASDASTVTTVSGNVSQWNDKSGNGRNATQGTAANRPAYTSAALNGLNVVTFDGSNDWMGLASSFLSNQTAFSWYLVARRSVGTQAVVFGERIANNDAAVMLILFATASIANRAGGTSASAVIDQTESFTLSTAVTYIFGSVQAATSGNSYRNGTSTGSTSATKASLTFNRMILGATANNGIGTDGNASFLNGYIGELIVSLSTHSTTTRQLIEGYLAHKWGLTSGLPSGHPYKTVPPYL